MSLFEVKLSGNPSFGVSRTISNTLTHLNERYLHGHRDKTTVIVEYLARDILFVKGRSLSDLDQNLLTVTLTPLEDLSEDDRATFVMAAFHTFDEVIGELHSNSFIRIVNQTGSFVYYKYFQEDK
jgi:4-oxalocrotonate tautomerase